MTNTKELKRTLLSSVVALLICFAMLLGTTFAWFTDSVTSGSNIIKAGNLDIDVEYTLDGKEWKDLEGATDLFGGLWEPGHTEVVALKVTNNGTLALKYNANMNIFNETVGKTKDGEDIVLSDILEVSTFWCQYDDGIMGQFLMGGYFGSDDPLNTYYNTASFKASNVLGSDLVLVAGDANYFIVKVDMPETVGNEANAKDKDSVPSIAFGINIFATQYTEESDSFGNDYDEGAQLPVAVSAASQAELNSAIAGDADIVYLADGTYTLPASKNNEFTLIGNGNTVINLTKATGQNLSGTDITFENLTVQGNNSNYIGIQHAGNIVYNNVVFNESTTLYGESVTFNNCTFNLTTRYIWTYGADEVTFNACTFYTAGKAVLVYDEGSINSQVVNFTDCFFFATETAYTSAGEACAAVEIDGSLIKGAYTVNFNGTNTVSDNFNGIYRIKKQKDPANVTVNQNGTVEVTNAVPVFTAAELQNALDADENVVVLMADITGDVTINQKENVNITIDGNGNEYTGTMYINGHARYEGEETLTIQNIAFVADTKMDFISSNETGAVERYAHNVTIQNCSFTGNGAEVMGARFRQAYNITMKDCVADGMYGIMWATGCTMINVENVDATNGRNGISIGTSNATIKNCDIAVSEYGIRADGNGYTLSLEGNTISAKQPVIVRKLTGAGYKLNLVGNTLNAIGADAYQVILTTGSNDVAYVAPAAANYTITGQTNLVFFK